LRRSNILVTLHIDLYKKGRETLGAVKIQEGNRVRVKVLGQLGTVKTLNAVKSGGRGRPKTVAVVELDSGSSAEWGIPDLTLV
jgi:hypothetical protein